MNAIEMSSLQNMCKCSFNLLHFTKSGHNLQFVRFRKPRWIPIAPSKIYRINERRPIDPVEYTKMVEWTRIYNTDMKSFRRYISKHNAEIELCRKQEINRLAFPERYAKMVNANNAWNEATGIIRTSEMEALSVKEQLQLEKMAEIEQMEREQMRQSAEAKLAKIKEISSSIITEDTLDEKLDQLMNTRSDFEFALKLDGSKTKETDRVAVMDNSKQSS